VWSLILLAFLIAVTLFYPAVADRIGRKNEC
jgi:hypothetical protein